jgi:hypothetical protein
MRAGDVDIAGARIERPVWRHEAVAARMRLQAADIQVHLFGQTEPVAANLDEVARGDKGFDLALERRAFVARNFENLQQLAHGGRVVHSLAHQREHLIERKHLNLG